MVTDSPIQAILDHLVERIVDVLPISSAGVTLISPGLAPHFIAASDGDALRYETLQSELDEGPCTDAFISGQAVSAPDLTREDRFPTVRCSGARGQGSRCSSFLCATVRNVSALDLIKAPDH
jgi:hypothetical protein